MSIFTALISGLVFGLGLILSGMTNPAKVLGYLDLFGQWDPSLALVMAGAIAVGLIGFHGIKKRQTSLLGLPLKMPTASHIDRRLVVGNIMFGIGWGLAGYCPGPALVALGNGQRPAMLFIGAMLLGMVIFDQLEKHK
ncbi:MAG: YeeE/YedE family protein [Aquabacterium sp.]|nr:YeeE/YedE family protein [Aquabacterium sp.]